MGEKVCYQAIHPDARTPCFEEAGNRACSFDTCAVYRAISQSTLARTLGSAGFRYYIESNLLHNVCRMSKFSPGNEEFRQRTSYKA